MTKIMCWILAVLFLFSAAVGLGKLWDDIPFLIFYEISAIGGFILSMVMANDTDY